MTVNNLRERKTTIYSVYLLQNFCKFNTFFEIVELSDKIFSQLFQHFDTDSPNLDQLWCDEVFASRWKCFTFQPQKTLSKIHYPSFLNSQEQNSLLSTTYIVFFREEIVRVFLHFFQVNAKVGQLNWSERFISIKKFITSGNFKLIMRRKKNVFFNSVYTSLTVTFFMLSAEET